MYWFFPETTGHTLEDMDAIFKLANGASDIVKVSQQMRQQRAKDGFEKKNEKMETGSSADHAVTVEDQSKLAVRHIEAV